MVDNVGKIDLLAGQRVNRAYLTAEQKANPIYLFTVKNHDEARKKSEEMADSRLEKIAHKAIAINDKYSDHYWEFWNLYFRSLKIANEFDGETIAGHLRQKALNSLYQAQTNKPADPQNLPKASSQPISEIMDGWFKSTPTKGLSEAETSKIAKKIFSDTSKSGLFLIMPKEKSDNISLYVGSVDSEKYDSLEDEKGNFKGLTINSFEIPKEYQKLIETMTAGKESFSKAEANKLVEIVKALETINAYSKKQQHDSAITTQKEDVDLFDLSGDGLLNRGDISAIELLLKYANDKEFKETLDKTTKNDWNKLSLLQEISKSKNGKETKNLFDLNGDGSADENDFELFQKTLKANNINKFDLNGDFFIDKKDHTIITEYLKAILARVDEAENFRKNTEEIFGGKQQLNYLQKKLAEQ